MPIVPYCVIEASAPATSSLTGVGGAPVCTLEAYGLRAFYSEVPAFPTDASALKAEALRFHAVIADIFKHAALIQFRLPTMLDNVEELRAHIEKHALEYREFLHRVRELVQMEVRISGPPSAQPETSSGREYLLSKQAASQAEERYSLELQSAASDLIRDWKVRKTQNGLRCYALIARADIERFRQLIQSVLSSEPGVHAVLSGPWPATEFLDVTVKA
jgi:Gas vesicle synthesis protein GvpL/GvpF